MSTKPSLPNTSSWPHFPHKSLVILGWFWRNFLRPYRLTLALSVVCMSVAAWMTGWSARLVKDVFDGIFMERSHGQLWGLVSVVFSVFFLKGLAAYGHSFLLASVGQRVGAALQRGLFRHITRADQRLFQSYSSGKLLSLLTYDTQVVFRGMTQTLVSIVRDSLTLFFLVSLMFQQDWFLACLACFGFPVSVFTVLFLGKRMRRIASEAQKSMGVLHAFFGEVFQGMQTVKAYTLEKTLDDKAFHKTDRFVRLSLKNARMKALLHPLMELMGGIAVSLVLLYGGNQVIQGVRTPGALMSFIAAFLMSYEPLKKLAHLNSYVQEALAALQRIYPLFFIPSASQEGQQSQKDLTVKKGAIAYRKIGFFYRKNHGIFQDFSLDIPGGRRVAFVGGSGAGKSTLLSLLLRFYPLNSGQILIDGQNIADLNLASLREKIAFVPQEITLFDDTVANNIRYGSLGATESDIHQAASDAYAHEFIQALPDGYDTMVGERGHSLSGGQRQRLALARAFLKNAPILLLDEATSALDATSENKVQEALVRLMKGRTTLIIAHRLSTAQQAECIYVLEKGKLVQQGTHDVLVQQEGAYKTLIFPQLLHQ